MFFLFSRYSPYHMPTFSSAGIPCGLAGSIQYTAASPVSQTTPAVLSAITSPAVNPSVDAQDQAAAAAGQAALQQHQAAAFSALSYPQAYPLGLPAIDWASMYSLPVGMYTL